MICTIPRSNVLRFVDNDEMSNPYNHDNRLAQYDGLNWWEPTRKTITFSTNDKICFQVASDYQTLAFTIYNSSNVLKDTYTLAEVHDYGNGVKAMQYIIDTAMLGGIYYCKLTATQSGAPTKIYTSDYFSIDNYSTYPLLEWKTKSGDGIYYDTLTKFGMRIKASIHDTNNPIETDSFETIDNIVNNDSTVKRVILVKFDPVQKWIKEKILIALSHQEITINGREYVPIDSPKETILDDGMYSIESSLREVDFETYAEFADAGGTPPTPEADDYLTWDDTDGFIYDDDNDNLINYYGT